MPIAPPAEWVEELRATLPELPWARRARVKAEWGLSDPELRDLVNAGALDLIAATVAAGAPPAEARSWWVVVPGAAGQHPRRRAASACRSRRRRWRG